MKTLFFLLQMALPNSVAILEKLTKAFHTHKSVSCTMVFPLIILYLLMDPAVSIQKYKLFTCYGLAASIFTVRDVWQIWPNSIASMCSAGKNNLSSTKTMQEDVILKHWHNFFLSLYIFEKNVQTCPAQISTKSTPHHHTASVFHVLVRKFCVTQWCGTWETHHPLNALHQWKSAVITKHHFSSLYGIAISIFLANVEHFLHHCRSEHGLLGYTSTW